MTRPRMTTMTIERPARSALVRGPHHCAQRAREPSRWDCNAVDRGPPRTGCRWSLTLAGLLGAPLPTLPAIPGRVHHKPFGGRDLLAEQWEAAEQRIRPGWLGPRP